MECFPARRAAVDTSAPHAAAAAAASAALSPFTAVHLQHPPLGAAGRRRAGANTTEDVDVDGDASCLLAFSTGFDVALPAVLVGVFDTRGSATLRSADR